MSFSSVHWLLLKSHYLTRFFIVSENGFDNFNDDVCMICTHVVNEAQFLKIENTNDTTFFFKIQVFYVATLRIQPHQTAGVIIKAVQDGMNLRVKLTVHSFSGESVSPSNTPALINLLFGLDSVQ